MSAYRPFLRSLLFIPLLLLTCLLSACDSPAPSGVVCVWIDAPIDGLRVPAGQAVQIEGHAAFREGVARVEIWVNGELHLVEESPPLEGNLAHFDQSWMPPGPGDYTVQVVAIGADGSGSEPDFVRLYVGEEVAEVTPTPTVVPTVSPPPTTVPTAPPSPTAVPTASPPPTAVPTAPPPTPTSPPEAVIEFWADATQVNAGSCTTLHWHVANVQAVFFDGAGATGDGSHQTCPCSDETHTLTVTLTDDSQVQRSITIHVTGSCDTTAPPAPVQLKPQEGETLPCCAALMLRWSPVSDPSGIAEYRVQVERAGGDYNWQPLDDSPWTGLTAPELELEVECGWYYRWRVQAVDGAGNVGPFSDWSEFTVPLT